MREVVRAALLVLSPLHRCLVRKWSAYWQDLPIERFSRGSTLTLHSETRRFSSEFRFYNNQVPVNASDLSDARFAETYNWAGCSARVR